jgi:hypothetical protein
MERHPHRGWRFAGRCGHEVRRSYDKALTSRDSDPTLPNGSKTVRGAYSTRAYARVNGGVKARNLGGKPIEINAFGQQCEFPQEDYFGQGMNSLGQPHQLPPRRRRNRCLSALEASKLDFGSGASYLSPRVGQGTDRSLRSGDNSGPRHEHRLHQDLFVAVADGNRALIDQQSFATNAKPEVCGCRNPLRRARKCITP